MCFLILPIGPWEIRSFWALSVKACWLCWLTYQPRLSSQPRQWIVASLTASLRCPTPELWQFMQLLNKLWKLVLAQRTLPVHFGGRLMVQNPAFSNHLRTRLQQYLQEGRLMCLQNVYAEIQNKWTIIHDLYIVWFVFNGFHWVVWNVGGLSWWITPGKWHVYFLLFKLKTMFLGGSVHSS